MPATYTNLLFHLVFSTKKRQPLIKPEFQSRLYEYLGGAIRGEGGSLVEIGGIADHVHLLVGLKPTSAVADVMRVIKANSSKWINEEHLLSARFSWQDGYSAFSVSVSQLETVARYIRSQAEHHQRRDFREELMEILRRHRVEFEERYLD